MNQRQVIRHALVAGLRDRRKIDRFAGGQPAPHHRFARLQQMEEWAALPILRRLALIGAPIIHRLDRIRQIRAPAQHAPLVDRVERVENDHGAGHRNPRSGDPPAEPGHQLAVGSTD